GGVTAERCRLDLLQARGRIVGKGAHHGRERGPRGVVVLGVHRFVAGLERLGSVAGQAGERIGHPHRRQRLGGRLGRRCGGWWWGRWLLFVAGAERQRERREDD